MQKINYFDDLTIYTVARKALLVPFRYSINLVDNWYSLNFIRSGNLLLRRDQMMNSVKGPLLFWERPGVEYQFSRDRDELCPYEQYWIDCGGRRSRKLVESLERSFPKGFVELPSAEPFFGLFCAMVKDFHKNERLYHGRIVLALEQIVWHLLQVQMSIHKEEFNEKSLERIAEDIRFNPFQPFDFRKIAELFPISYDHFRRCFRKKMNCSLHSYVVQQRMLQAAAMLTLHHFRIKEVANACGFTEISSFSRAFRHYYGLSPRDWILKAESSAEGKEKETIELKTDNNPILINPNVTKLSFFSQKGRMFFKGEPDSSRQ